MCACTPDCGVFLLLRVLIQHSYIQHSNTPFLTVGPMMYGFGDSKAPLDKTIQAVEVCCCVSVYSLLCVCVAVCVDALLCGCCCVCSCILVCMYTSRMHYTCIQRLSCTKGSTHILFNLMNKNKTYPKQLSCTYSSPIQNNPIIKTRIALWSL